MAESGRADWRARALLSADALGHNLRCVRAAAPGARVMAVIKADAYGHGMQSIRGVIGGDVDAFAVATIDEGVTCRALGHVGPVVVLSGFWKGEQLEIFAEHQLQPVVHTPEQLDWIRRYRGAPLSVWLKFDSGMNRLGLERQAFRRAHADLAGLDRVREIRLMSHLANADLAGDDYTHRQLERFRRATAGLPGERSLANSAGVLGWPRTHLDWVRPGLMLYGVPPAERFASGEAGLRPVMHLQARILSTRWIRSGRPVGYGGEFTTTRKTRAALVGAGYGDGYPRNLGEGACVLVHGRRVPIIGRVSMDMITIDVTGLGEVNAGDVATLWGPGLEVSEVAGWAGVIPYELLCKVTPRIPRVMQ